MAKSYEVLEMLCKGVEYVCKGENFEDIDWLDKKPAITNEQYQAGFAQYDAWKAQQDASQAAAKAALLERLGINEDEARLLLS
jgi:hypothetical protein